MSQHSILVALSGSEQSRNAAEIAWKIAGKLKAKVTAEHIVDSRTIWELLRHDKPGFIGSGPSLAIYETIVTQLQSLANKLSAEYEALAAGENVKGECLIKEGNPVSILCKDAKEYDLLVIGHQPSGVESIEQERSHYIRYSVAEGISHNSTTPILIVQSKPLSWESLTIVSEIDHINYSYIRASLQLAKLLALKPTLEFWGTGTREEKPEQLKSDLLEALPEAKELNIEFDYYGGRAATERNDLFHGKDMGQPIEIRQDALFVLPTRGLAHERITVFGLHPESFIRSLVLPCLLLWPEDNNAFDLTENKETQQLSAGKK
ncbi:MAG: universal stress protein [Candidatus Obscuribacterales bacterium]|nr:universal stress protein [Candidatus Obscuribacterales bacterium]